MAERHVSRLGYTELLTDGILAFERERIGEYGDRLGVEQPVEQIGEVAGFAQHGAADAWIRHPVGAGNAG